MRAVYSNYDCFPSVFVPESRGHVWSGIQDVMDRLQAELAQAGNCAVLVVDTYPGADERFLLETLERFLRPDEMIHTLSLRKPEDRVLSMMERNLTDDRIFGVLSCHHLEEFFDAENLEKARRRVSEKTSGLTVICGVGAALVSSGDVLVFADMARWETQLRFRKGAPNWGADNGAEDFFRKYKRAFFVEWRVADRHKNAIFPDIDFFLDTHDPAELKLAEAQVVRRGIRQAVHQPFRVVPFFDPAPWGGQWMREVCGLDAEAKNYGWCFDCVPEENSLFLDFEGIRFELPSIDLVFQHPVELLGNLTHARFGTEFPIRFDFLDTMDGGNLSFQVHPLTEYIQQWFGMHYTQDESYYLLDAVPDAAVYLGLRDDVDPDSVRRDLQAAQDSAETPFDAEKYVARWPAKKHDHFLIPAGTCHCSGAGCMVLEISATPYIFTFKMWDWERLGLDGRPRPVHLEHGLANIQWDRTASWTERELVNQVETVADGNGWKEERTGLHAREFIETRRHWFTDAVPHDTCGTVNVLNLVEGAEAIVESPTGAFNPFVVHYAETFIVPASVGTYTIRPYGRAEGTECATVKAYVRGTDAYCSN